MISQIDRIRSQLLVLRYRNGDDESFRELVSIWEKPLFYYIRRLVNTEEDAWDVLQESWIRILRGIGRLSHPESLPAWLYRIARNSALNHARDNRRAEIPAGGENDHAAMEPYQDEGFSALDAESIHRGLQQLSVAHREVLTLLFLEDFSIREICSITGVSTGTIKSRLHYAKKALHEIMGKESGCER